MNAQQRHARTRLVSRYTGIIAMLLAASLFSNPAGAATFIVDNPDDYGPGNLWPGTLRWAIHQANTRPGADTIEWRTKPGSKTHLEHCLPPITDSVDMRGPGADALEIYAPYDVAQRMGYCFLLDFDLFASAGPQTSAVRNLTLVGDASTIGIVLGRNTALVVDRARVVENHYRMCAIGGPWFPCFGTGILNDGGQLTLQDSVVANNVGGRGLELYPRSVTRIINSQIHHNSSAWNNGGGINVQGSSLEVVNSSIYRNEAGFLPPYTGEGGGIFSYSTRLYIENSTLSANRASDANGGGGLAFGGRWGEGSLLHVTLADNRAPAGGGLAIARGTGLYIHNSLIADNAGGDCSLAGVLKGEGNMSSDSTCSIAGGSNSAGHASTVGAAGDWGCSTATPDGCTWTHQLNTRSPALSFGYANWCARLDQRGVSRGFDGDCDAGAFELP